MIVLLFIIFQVCYIIKLVCKLYVHNGYMCSYVKIGQTVLILWPTSSGRAKTAILIVPTSTVQPV